MITNINKRLLWMVLIAGLITSSCKKSGFLDSNNDPNRVTDQTVTPELIFPNAAHQVGRRTNTDLGFLEHWVGYFANNGDFAPTVDEITYNITNTFGDALFQNRYDVLFDLHQAEVKGLATGDTAVAAASMILSAKVFQELVDLYGDIPYSQAFQSDKFPHPAYDKAKDIYDSLQIKLDKAVGYFHLPIKKAFLNVDIVTREPLADKNAAKWIRFANTLKLRLLIRQSEISGFNPAPEIAKILANGDVLMAGDNMTVNPGYVNDNNKQNPFYAAYGYDVSGNKASTSTDANQYIVNILTSNNDPRLKRFFLPVGNNFVGDRYGDLQANLPLGNVSSYFGPGLVSSPTQDQPIYLGFQSLFLRAEAVARGWIPGDAKTAYMAAVTESFVYLGVPNAQTAATNYMTNNSSADFANAGSTTISKVKFIVYQKYIANTGLDPLEAYSDIRRLNFLSDNSYISAASGRISSVLPLRLPYPQSEFTTNGDQVGKEGAINIFQSKLFWEQP